MAGNKREMQLFVKIFQAVGMAMQNTFTKKDELQPKRILILRLNYSLGAKQQLFMEK
jgi:hypothetical protein